MNAGMYAVTPEVEGGWRALVEYIAHDAHVALTYVPELWSQSLDEICHRADLGAVQLCGYTLAIKRAAVTPIAAPIPHASWAAGRAVYRTDLIVRKDAPYRTLEDTFGARAGWTATHSQSGFNAFRHHLLAFRTPQRRALYGEMVGDLVSARNVLECVRDGRITLGPVDAYWHLLIRRHAPQLTEDIRIVGSTEVTAMPPFVAAIGAPEEMVRRLRASFIGAATQGWFKSFTDLLLIEGFAEPAADAFSNLLEWEREAKVAGFELPA